MNKEQLYNDFINKLLPKIQEGAAITKDYFMDLFGRYVKYLIITDTIKMVIGVGLLFVAYKAFKFAYIKYKNEENEEYNSWITVSVIIGIFALFFGVVFFLEGGFYLIKDIYIPEVRIYEILNNK